jgi:hypothetical protein
VRFALTVHGVGEYAFVSTLVRTAREKGVSAYIGDGANRWSAVHRSDAAHLDQHRHRDPRRRSADRTQTPRQQVRRVMDRNDYHDLLHGSAHLGHL